MNFEDFVIEDDLENDLDLKKVSILDKNNKKIKGKTEINQEKESFVFKPKDSQQLKGTTIIVNIKSDLKQLENKTIKNIGTITFKNNNKVIKTINTNDVSLKIKNTKTNKTLNDIKNNHKVKLDKNKENLEKATNEQPLTLAKTGAN